MAFEEGNTYGKKSKLFDQALRRAIAQNDGEKVRQCAETLLDKAVAGEPWAVQMLADRLDGRAAQTVTVDAAPEVLEGLSTFAAFLAQATGQAESGRSEGMGESGPVLPVAVSTATH